MTLKELRTMVLEFLIVFAVFLVIDAIWLSNAAKLIYQPEIGALLLEKPNFVVAFIFYLIYAAGIMVFAVHPHLQHAGYAKPIAYGAFLGFLAYSTYNFTNLSVMKGYTTKIALIDVTWGTVLTGTVVGVSLWIIRALKLATPVS
jgi:uncharacterized membrane protein